MRVSTIEISFPEHSQQQLSTSARFRVVVTTVQFDSGDASLKMRVDGRKQRGDKHAYESITEARRCVS